MTAFTSTKSNASCGLQASVTVNGKVSTVIELKNYVLRRIVEIKKHRQLTPTITFDDLFFKCRLENISRKKKMDARNIVIKFFEHLKKEKFIKDFEVVKRGNSFYSVTFPK